MAKGKVKGGEKGRQLSKPKSQNTKMKLKSSKKAKKVPAKGSKVTEGILDRLNLNKEEEEKAPNYTDPNGEGYNPYPGVGSNQEDLLANLLAGLHTNQLDEYVSNQMRNDFIRDENYIRNALNNATNASYDVQRAQALRDAVNAENTNLANTRNAISEMRKQLIGSASSGANVGAANATALQALLGLGQQNTQVTTEGLQNINNVERERAATLAQNAVDAINQANSATNDMYGAATSAYGSDRSYAAQGAAQAVGEIKSTRDTNATNERMNAATLANERAIAELRAAADKDIATTQGKYGVRSAKAGSNQNITYHNK
jgi:hypothetical protein